MQSNWPKLLDRWALVNWKVFLMAADLFDSPGPNATRLCQGNGFWGNPDLTRCVREDLQDALEKVSFNTVVV